MHLKAIRGVPWTLASYGASKAVNVLSTIVLARLVAPADFGLVALATLALNLLGLVKDMGLGGTLIVRNDLTRREQGTVLTLMIVVSFVLAGLGVAAAPLAADFFDEPRLTAVLAAMSGMLLISGFSSFYEVLLQREMEFQRRFAALIAQSVVTAAVAIGLAVAGAGVWSLVAGQIAGLAVFGVVAVALAPYRVAPAFQTERVRSLLGTSAGFLLQNLATFGRQNADYAVVGRAFGASVVGFYSMAYRLGDMTYWAIADPVARVTFPSFARTSAEGGDVRAAFLSVLRLVALIACPLGVMLSASAEPFTEALFGERWEPMVPALAVLGIWAAVRPIDTTFNWLLNALGEARIVGVFSLAALVAVVPAFVAAATFGDIEWVAAVVVADALASFAFMAAVTRRRAEVTLRRQWASLRPVVLACVPLWIATRLTADALAGLPSGVTLTLALLAGGVAYLAALVLLAPGLLRDAVRQVGRTFAASRSRRPDTRTSRSPRRLLTARPTVTSLERHGAQVLPRRPRSMHAPDVHRPSFGRRLLGIEGLRAIAASTIVLSHVWLYSAPNGSSIGVGSSAEVLFRSLALGVTLFFVLSGFLLYRPYVAAVLRRTPLPSPRAYFRNRALRIVPAYWVILLAIGLLFQSAVVQNRSDGTEIGALTDPGDLLATLTLTHDYSPGTLGLGIGPAWSLAIEIVFYLFVPLLGGLAALLAARWTRRPALSCLAPAVVLLLIGLSGKFAAGVVWPGESAADGWGPTWHAVIERSFWAQADLFSFGMAVAVLRVKAEDGTLTLPPWWRKAVVALAVPIAAVAAHRLGWAQLSYLPENTVIAAAFAALLALVVMPSGQGHDSRLAHALEWRPLVSVGVVSYSLFLWHEPLVHWLREQGVTLNGAAGLALNLAMVAVLAGALSALTYRYVERPALRRKRGMWSRRPAEDRPEPTIAPGEELARPSVP